MVRVTEFDPSAFLDSDEVAAEYLTAALEDANPDVFLAAVGHVAKARGMSAIAERSGLSRIRRSRRAPSRDTTRS
jgi:probable addiction module antidote protein